jgi:hypothetical protein
MSSVLRGATMDPNLVYVFQIQLLSQCRFALLASSDVTAANEQGDIFREWYGLQNFIVASANISKILWGQRGRLSEERKPLRDAIAVSDASPLRDVVLRNHFEHIDERLDRWWGESKQRGYVDFNIGPYMGMGEMGDVVPTNIFRWFDPDAGEMIFWGERFNLTAMLIEVKRLEPLLHAIVERPRQDPTQK